MTMITDTGTLAGFCSRLSGAPFITVDTEFMREKTFWSQLCLIQVAGPEEATAIDVLADGLDLAPFFDVMADTSILKVFHAARQDLEIFYHLAGVLPTPVVDTQVAAMVCGFGEQVGYETLIARTTKAKVDKSSRFTDWSLRPLSERQINYALSDVTLLRPAYEVLKRKLHSNGREKWIEEEMKVLTAPETYAIHPENAFRRIKSRGAKARDLAVLREVAAWRDMEAQSRDLPRNRILRDEALVEIAHHRPKTVAELARTRGLGQRLAEGNAGRAILEAVVRGLDVPNADCPQPKAKQPLPRGLGPVTDLLKVLLKMKCEDSQVAQKLLASASDVERIAAYGEDADVPALRGWRRQVFGEDALKLRSGKTTIAINGKALKLVEIPEGG